MLKFFGVLSILILVVNYTSPMINGRDAGEEEFKFIASLVVHERVLNKVFPGDEEDYDLPYGADPNREYPLGHFCGGAIINEHWVLTAAHCFLDWFKINTDGRERKDGLLKAEVRVKVGDHNLNPKKSTLYHIEKVISHQSFSKSAFVNDISLVLVKTPIAFDSRVEKIMMADGWLTKPGENVIMAGWGQQSESKIEPAGYLQVIDRSEIVTPEECINSENQELDTESFICIKNDPGTGLCKRDSGGPIVVESKDEFYLAGVISHGSAKECATGKPDIITKISFFKGWIENTMCENRLPPPGKGTKACILRRLMKFFIPPSS